MAGGYTQGMVGLGTLDTLGSLKTQYPSTRHASGYPWPYSLGMDQQVEMGGARQHMVPTSFIESLKEFSPALPGIGTGLFPPQPGGDGILGDPTTGGEEKYNGGGNLPRVPNDPTGRTDEVRELLGRRTRIGPWGNPLSPEEWETYKTTNDPRSPEWAKARHYTMSCFIDGVQVELADGSEKNVSEISVGDVVKTNEGEGSVVKVFHGQAGGQKLYGFNGKEPFVTEAHPFMTQRGWKKVSELEVGDTLYRNGLGNDTVKSIKSIDIPEDTPVYNFHVDTHENYFADGYLVHNKSLPLAVEVGGDPETMKRWNKSQEDASRFMKMYGEDPWSVDPLNPNNPFNSLSGPIPLDRWGGGGPAVALPLLEDISPRIGRYKNPVTPGYEQYMDLHPEQRFGIDRGFYAWSPETGKWESTGKERGPDWRLGDQFHNPNKPYDPNIMFNRGGQQHPGLLGQQQGGGGMLGNK